MINITWRGKPLLQRRRRRRRGSLIIITFRGMPLLQRTKHPHQTPLHVYGYVETSRRRALRQGGEDRQ